MRDADLADDRFRPDEDRFDSIFANSAMAHADSIEFPEIELSSCLASLDPDGKQKAYSSLSSMGSWSLVVA